MRKSGNKIRVSVQLIQAETGFHVWSNEYDKEMTDVFQMQSDISNEVTDALKIVLTDEEKNNITRRQVVELTAYDFYLKARSELMNFRLAGALKGMQYGNNAMDLFDQAIRIDPKFARAYTGIGLALFYKGDRSAFVERTLIDSAKQFADKALQLDNEVDEAYFIRGIFHAQRDEVDKAIAEFKRALELNPNYPDAMMWLGRVNAFSKQDYVTGLSQMARAVELGRGPELAQNLKLIGLAYDFLGLSDEALEYYNSGTQLDGDSSTLLLVRAGMLSSNEDYETALRITTRVQLNDTTDFVANDSRAWYMTLLGRYKEALDSRLKWENSFGHYVGDFNTHRIGQLYWMLDDKKSAMKYFNRYIAYAEEEIMFETPNARAGYVAYDLAGVYVFLGDKKKAYHYLDEVNKISFVPTFLLQYFKDDPMFNSIRGEERFKKIHRELEEKNKKERDRVTIWLQQQSWKTKLHPKL